MTLGPDLHLDPLTHDLVVTGGDLELAIDAAQAVKIRLLFFRDDWFLNRAIGVPYFDQVFVKNPRAEHLAAIYREEIAATPGIVRVDDVNVSIAPQTRRLSVDWSAVTTETEIGSVVEVG
jgi:hypothetical protein